MDTINIWCIIIPLITAILGWLLRHLTCKCNHDDNDDELNQLKEKNSQLLAELDACTTSKKKVAHELDLCLTAKADLASKSVNNTTAGLGIANSFTNQGNNEPELIFDAAAAKLAIGKKIVADDLKIVEGIGPKIAQLFNDYGVKTWYQLSITPLERCQEILNSGGKRYEIHNPTSWPRQSKLAFDGKWKELNDLQDYLDGGVEPK